MRALIQRVSQANVKVDSNVVGEIGPGLVVLLGVTHKDNEKDIDQLVNKIVNLRVFEDEKGHFEKSIIELNKPPEGSNNYSSLQGYGVLIVSQFTLYGSTKKGRRPDFTAAAKPELAESLYKKFVEKMRETGLNTATGVFGAYMQVELINDGPVTFMIDSQS